MTVNTKHMTSINYYRLLALTPNASATEIKARYRQLSLRYHPDQGGSTAKMARLNEAYRILSNDSLRRQYDRKHRIIQHPRYNDFKVVQPKKPVAPAEVRPQPVATKSRRTFWMWVAAPAVFVCAFLGYGFYSFIQPVPIVSQPVAALKPRVINAPITGVPNAANQDTTHHVTYVTSAASDATQNRDSSPTATQ